MFEKRIRIVLATLAVIGLIMTGRLFQLQILQREVHVERANRVLMRPVRHLPFVRGTIRTADGHSLASDQPSWNVSIHYGMLSGDERYLGSLVDARLDSDRRRDVAMRSETRETIFRQFNQTWADLARIGGVSREELLTLRDSIIRSVERVRRSVSAHHGFEQRIPEEFMAHPIIRGLNDQEQIDVNRIFADKPWVEIQPSMRRAYTKNQAFAHLVGRMGRVTREMIDRSTIQDDPARRYLLAGDVAGVTGLESAFEQRLRGKRGRIRADREGNVVFRSDPVYGKDVTLTIEYELQSRIYDVLARNVNARDLPGGAVVVLHVPTREIRALVSYPSFDPNRLRERKYYARLRDNTHALPLVYRPVSAIYAPGSIVKPLVVLAGLAEGAVRLDSVVDCQGYLLPNQFPRWREWRDANTRLPIHHGPTIAEEAIKRSCNIYCGRLADHVDVETFCRWFGAFGLGRPSGTGLREESSGTLPTAEYLQGRGVTPAIAHARDIAIGQGYLTVTPLQAANAIATLASGVFKQVRLVQDDGFDRPPVPLKGIAPEHFRAVRRGMYRVVNEPGGTAYHTANLGRDDVVLFGKTGSAQCSRRVLACDVKYQINDNPPQWKQLPIGDPRAAADKLALEYRAGTKIQVLESRIRELWPPDDHPDHKSPSHAWFVGYVLPASAPVDQVPDHVFVVLLEYGGSGGRVAGPVGKEIAELLAPRVPPAMAGVGAAVEGENGT